MQPTKWPIHGVQPKKWLIHAEQVADSWGATYEGMVEKGRKRAFKNENRTHFLPIMELLTSLLLINADYLIFSYMLGQPIFWA